MAQIIHGGKFGTKHKSKCGLWRNAIWDAGDVCLTYMNGISKVNCKACLAKHKEGKC